MNDYIVHDGVKVNHSYVIIKAMPYLAKAWRDVVDIMRRGIQQPVSVCDQLNEKMLPSSFCFCFLFVLV